MMEPMICETFLQFRYLSDLGLSPDGRYTAYIRQQANLASNGYDARLWVYDHSTGADRPLSSLSPVRAFSWMDNRTILFSGMRGTAGSASQDTTTYYALPVDGGEAQPLFTVPMRAGRARRLTDGRFVFTATVDMNRPNLDSLSPRRKLRPWRNTKTAPMMCWRTFPSGPTAWASPAGSGPSCISTTLRPA